jgi:hypothetical protein
MNVGNFFKLGEKLKRRLKYFLIITAVGYGTLIVYLGYRRYKWYHDMRVSDETIGTKPRVVVLGTGEELIQLFFYFNSLV